MTGSTARQLVAIIALTPFFGMRASAQEIGHLHHVHMNVTDIARTTEFYRRIFGVVPIQYNGKMPALLMERSFLFLNKKEAGTIGNHQRTGLTHFSWSAIDGNHEYQWLKSQGVEFYTPLTELGPGTTYMYLYGPDKEVVEMFDAQRHHRFNHVHMLAKDPGQTADFFHSLIHSEKKMSTGPIGGRNLDIDDIAFSIQPIGARFTPRENDGTTLPTDNTHLDHIAFSFRDLSAAYKRIKKEGVEIVRPMSLDKEYGFRHFFVRAPNGILVELVEAKPWPEAAWER